MGANSNTATTFKYEKKWYGFNAVCLQCSRSCNRDMSSINKVKYICPEKCGIFFIDINYPILPVVKNPFGGIEEVVHLELPSRFSFPTDLAKSYTHGIITDEKKEETVNEFHYIE